MLLRSASAPVTPQQTGSFAAKESTTPGTAVGLRLNIEQTQFQVSGFEEAAEV